MLESFFTPTTPSKNGGWLSRDPLALAALAAIVGILLADYFILQPAWLAVAILALAISASCLLRNTLLLIALTSSAFALIHTLELRWIDEFPELETLTNPHNEPPSLPVSAQGLVVDEPSIYASGRGANCLLRLHSLSLGGHQYNGRHQVRLRIDRLPEALGDLAYGDTLQLTGHIQALQTARNPGVFSPADFYRRSEGVTAEIRCNPGHSIARTARSGGNPLIRIAQRSRDWLGQAITRDLDDSPDTASIIRAMVLGAREDTPEAIEEQFRLSGSLHIFAVSGLHIGLFGLISWQLLKLSRVPRRVAIWLIIPAILFYAVVTGLRPSACRAAVMGSIVLFSFVAGRQPRLINSLGLAALLLLAYDSQQLFLPGFQLSFAVLTSIAVLTPFFMGLIGRPFQLDPFVPRQLVPRLRRLYSKSGQVACNYLSVSLAAWIGSLPLIIYHFQLVTPVSIVANCFLVPMAMVVLSLAVVSLTCTLVELNFLSVLFNNTNWLAAKTCSLLTAFFASLPGGHFHFSFTPPPVDNSHPLYLAVLDTGGSGACQVLSTLHSPARRWPGTKSSLIDTGGSWNFQYLEDPFFRYRGINRFQKVFLTHNDSQHIGGTAEIITRYRPRQILVPLRLASSQAVETLAPQLEKNPTTLLATTAGNGWEIGASAEIDVLFPSQDHPPGPRADDNSMVLLLRCRGWRILFMGDSGFETEKWLMQNSPEHIACDVLVKGQHGSDLSGLEEFLQLAQPRAIVASNRPFPAHQGIKPAWRQMLQDRGIVLFDQLQTGAVEILVGTGSVQLKAYVNGQALTLSRRSP